MNLETVYYRVGEVERLLREHTLQDTENFEKLHTAMTNVRLDVQSLKTQARLWGAAGGTLAAAVVSAAMAWILKHLGVAS